MKDRFIDIEEALANEIRLKGILDNLQDAFFEADLQGNFTLINAVGIEMYGYHSLDELIGKPAKSLYSDNKEREKMLEKLRITGKLVDWTGLGLKKDGSTFWVSMNVQVIKDDAGQAIGTQGMVRDITWRKQSEEAVRLSEEKFRKAFFTSPDSIAINRLEDGMYISINKGFTQILEYTELDVSGKTSLELNIWVDFEDRKRLGQELKTKGFVENMEAKFRGKSGKILDGLMSANIIELEGVQHILSITRDITERKKIEKEIIIAKERAEESDRLKSAFLANMSHEIRTPMNGILGFAELLKEPSLSGVKQQEYIRIIEKAGARMLNIITDIIDISKIESGQMIVSITETNVNEQIEYLGKFFITEAENKGLSLYIRNSLPSSEATIKTDREKLYAILTNLIKNAIKYTERGFIEIGCQKKNDFLEFYVKDTGIAVPKDRQEAIFERFIQADIANKMAKQGAGLGLSISKAYVESLGGNIWIESERGIGSTFYFTLPYQVEPEVKTEDSTISAPNSTIYPSKNLHVLIAEDDEISERLIHQFVKEYSSSISIAKNGKEAIEMCRKNQHIDLILMDIEMPELNGLEATRQIRQFNKEVIIFAQTAFGLSSDREKTIEAGCNDYISKPIKKAELLGLINDYFKK